MNAAIQFIQDLAVIILGAAGAGLLCRRIGLSPIVGYLLTGVIVGPYTPPYPLVADLDRVHVLAQLGLVFLMFGIGLGFSVRRLRQLGLPVILATAGTALIVFTLGRMGGVLLGLDRTGTAFFAALIVVSSSVVIGKLLSDSGRAHEKSSQLALGMTLCEDLVAIVLLTLLGSYAQFGPEHAPMTRAELWQTLGLFAGFVLVAVTLGLLLVPRMLDRFSREANAELETLFVAGLLFGLSLMVVRAGYSLALGAFLLGAIVAETPQRPGVERAFGGLRDVFGAVFFVAIGMTIDWRLLPAAVVPIVLATALALIGRALAAGGMLMLMGYEARAAWRAGLILTPLGEFSFVIAQLGIANALLPPEYMGVAVGASLLTTLIAPTLAGRNEAIAARLARWRVPVLAPALVSYRELLENLQRRTGANLLWRLLRRRFVQIGLEVAVVSAVLVFAGPLVDWVVSKIGPQVWADVSTATVCWVALGALLLGPLIAIGRNFNAVVMIVVDYATGGENQERFRPVLTLALQTAGAVGLLFWLWNFVPEEARFWSIVAVMAVLAALAALLWRRFIFWHSTLEISLEESIGETVEEAASRKSLEWMDRYSPVGLQIGEISLPDNFAHMGRSIGEIGIRSRLGCTVIGIDRHSFTIPNPGPGSHVYPGDRLLLLGTAEQIAAARQELMAPAAEDAVPEADTFRDLVLDTVTVPEDCPVAGRTLADLQWAQRFGVQVVGCWQDENCRLNPPATTIVDRGSRLLVLGTPAQMRELRRQLSS